MICHAVEDGQDGICARGGIGFSKRVSTQRWSPGETASVSMGRLVNYPIRLRAASGLSCVWWTQSLASAWT